MLDLVLDLLSPPSCVGCGALSPTPWCEICTRRLPGLPWPRTPAPEGLASAWTWAAYEGPAGEAIRRAKYGGDERALGAVASGLGAAAAGRLPEVDLIVPVPQPWTTTLRRGVQPTAVLARALSRSIDRPVLPALRRRRGPAQAGLDREARAHNVALAFEGRGPLPARRVLLVDDVVTTGATATACARELLNLGATRVHLLAAADARA